MVRPITGSAQTALNKKLGLEFYPIIRIDWSGGSEYYGVKAETIGALIVQKRLANSTDISTVLREVSVGNVTSVGVELLDYDDSDTLKSKLQTNVLEGLSAVIYSFPGGLTDSDLITVLKGNVTGPIEWDEGSRILRFDIISNIRSDNVGFAPDQNDITNLHKEAINEPWPLCFGSVVHVPCTRIFRSPIGKTKSIVATTSTSIVIENGGDFPQSTPITIEINGILFDGSFSGEVFTVTEANKPKYTSIAVGVRQLADPDETDSRFFWILIADAAKTFVGYWLELTRGVHKRYAFCEIQEGTKLRCRFLPKGATDPHDDKIDQNWIITEVSIMLRDSWAIDTSITWEFGPPNSSGYPIWDYKLDLGLRWYVNSGAKVTQLGINDRYVANLIPSDTVKAVFGRKRTDQGEILAEIPSAWYTVSLSDPLGGKNPTTVTFSEPLEERKQNWTGEVFAVLKSTQGSDTAEDVIRYIVETYTNLSIDTSSFATVSTAIATKYPSHFFYVGNDDAIKLIQEIAWQARCGLRIFGSNVSIKYLSVEPSSDATVSETEIELKSFGLRFTEIEDIYTRLTGEWRGDGAQEEPFKYVKENNINTFGLREETRDVFIYNIESLVQKSINFWSTRLSNIWRKVILKTYPEFLKLEIFDTTTLALTDTSLLNIASIKSVVNDSVFNQDNGLITLELELPSKAGTSIVDSAYWLDDSGDPTPSDPVDSFSAPDEDLQALPEVFSSSNQIDRGGSTGGNGTGDLNVGLTTPTNVTDDTNTDLLSKMMTLFNQILSLRLDTQLFDPSTVQGDLLSNILAVRSSKASLRTAARVTNDSTIVTLRDSMEVRNIGGNKLALDLGGMGVWDAAAASGGLLTNLFDVIDNLLVLKQQGKYTDATDSVELSSALILKTITSVVRIAINANTLGFFDASTNLSAILGNGLTVRNVNGSNRVCLNIDGLGVYDPGTGLAAPLSDLIKVGNNGTTDVVALAADVNFKEGANTAPFAMRFDSPDSLFRAVEAFAEDA